MDEAITRMEKDIGIKEQTLAAAVSGKEDVAATKMTLDGLKKSIEKLKTTKAEGRIAIRLEPLEQLKKSPYDLELMGGDTLDIPQSPMAVTVLGEVASPTSDHLDAGPGCLVLSQHGRRTYRQRRDGRDVRGHGQRHSPRQAVRRHVRGVHVHQAPSRATP